MSYGLDNDFVEETSLEGFIKFDMDPIISAGAAALKARFEGAILGVPEEGWEMLAAVASLPILETALVQLYPDDQITFYTNAYDDEEDANG